MSRAVMQQALAYIEEVDYGPYDKWPVITALRAALAEPEKKAKPITADEMSAWVKDTWKKCQAEAWQEPVAWMHNHIEGNVIAHKPADIDRHPDRWTALYSTPQPCPTCEALSRAVMMDQTSHDTAPNPRRPLTDEEIVKLMVGESRVQLLYAKPGDPGYSEFAEGAIRELVESGRAIERAHGIGDSNG